MALNLIDVVPVLDYDYPLFSWDDFPQSRDALVPLTPVIQFESECWNDMVSKMHDVLIALEKGWELGPYFFDGEKKEFTAAMYNAMFDAMAGEIPLYSAWDKFQYYAHKGDPLTPGHLTFIAKWLNLVLGVARGTIELEELSWKHNSAVTFDAWFDAPPSVQIETTSDASSQGKTISSVNFEQLPAVPMFVNFKMMATLAAAAQAPQVLATEVDQPSQLNIAVEANRRTPARLALQWIQSRSISRAVMLTTTKTDFSVSLPVFSQPLANMNAWEAIHAAAIHTAKGSAAATLRADTALYPTASHIARGIAAMTGTVLPSTTEAFLPLIGTSLTAADVINTHAVDAGKMKHMAYSKQGAEAMCCVAENGSAEYMVRTIQEAEAAVPEAEPAYPRQLSLSKYTANITSQTSRPGWVEVIGLSLCDASAVTLDAENAAAGEIGTTQSECSLDLLESADIAADTLAFGSTECAAAIWLLPLQPDSKTLHIRQTYKEAIKIGNTLYIDEWPDQGQTDDGTLFLWKLYDTVLQVGNTLYIGSMPDTGKTDGQTLLIWDVEQEPVKTLNLLEVF